MISNNQGLENYLGKSILSYPNAILEYEEADIKRFGIEGDLFFFNNPYTYLHLNTDKKNIISNVSLMIHKIDEDIFDKMVLAYGLPDEMFKIDTVLHQEYSLNKDYNSKSTKGLAKPCDFKDNPLFIIWKKKEFKITISQHNDNWYSLITYQIPSK